MKKVLTILLSVLVTLGLFVSCNADVAETVFQNGSAEGYATLVGYSETKGRKQGSNEFGTVIKNALVKAGISESDISEYKYRFTIEFQANATTQPTEFIVSTPDSPQKAWVEVLVPKVKAAPVCNIYIKTAGSKFMANENSQEMFRPEDYNFNLFEHVKEINFNGVFDTSNVTNMQSMFENCRALSELDVTEFDTSNVTNMSNMFNNCLWLEVIDLSNFDTSKVTEISSMFYFSNTPQLKEVKLGEGAANITEIEGFSESLEGVRFDEFCFTGPKSVLDAMKTKLGGTWAVKQKDDIYTLSVEPS